MFYLYTIAKGTFTVDLIYTNFKTTTRLFVISVYAPVKHKAPKMIILWNVLGTEDANIKDANISQREMKPQSQKRQIFAFSWNCCYLEYQSLHRKGAQTKKKILKFSYVKPHLEKVNDYTFLCTLERTFWRNAK